MALSRGMRKMQDNASICFCMIAWLDCRYIEWFVGELLLKLCAEEEFSVKVCLGQLFTYEGEEFLFIFQIFQV